MSPLTYHRPQSVDEALQLLDAGVPLAGGTTLTPIRRSLEAVVDLQDLGLDDFHSDEATISCGASVSLQRLYEEAQSTLPALADALRREAAWNLRNQGTFVGALLSGGSRSPLLCAALALDPELEIAPENRRVRLSEFLELEGQPRQLITQVDIHRPVAMAYEQVGRAPMDRPLVSAASCRFGEPSDRGEYRLVLGGFGPRPVALDIATLESDADLNQAADLARERYAAAEDQWASSAYRSSVAATLIARTAKEVMA